MSGGAARPDAEAAGAVSRETEARLLALEEEFRKWAARINLVAPSTLPVLRARHIDDSLQILALADAACGPVTRVVDLGSGGGFPGLVIAAGLAGRPGASVHLVEAVAKKCAFLRHAARTLALPVTVHNGRIEAVLPTLPDPEIITARALAPLPDLLALAAPRLGPGVRAFFHKGREWREEVAAAHGAWRFDLVVHDSRIEAGSVVLEIAGLLPISRRPPR